MHRPTQSRFRVLLFAPLAVGGGCHCATLTNNAGADSAVVVVDGRLAGACVNDSVYRIVDGAVSLGTYDAPAGCNTEIVVFSDGDAVAVADPTSVFSSSYGTVSIDLTPDLISVPLAVWRADGVVGAAPPATTEVALAATLFDENHGGVTFTASYQTAGSTDSTTINTVAIDVWNSLSCSVTAITGNPAIYTAGQLNVYYTNQPFTGWHCGTSNIIMIGTLAQPESLTHELGHAFSLGHTNSVDYDADGVLDFDASNIMVGGGFGRDHYSEGQAWRMSLNATSDLNGLGYRTGATRACLDSAIDATCPWLALDGLPN